MDLKIEGEQLTKLIEGAVMQALGEAGREAIVKQVVKHLTTAPESTGYGSRPPSPLVRALNDAAERVAHKFLTDKLANDAEFTAAVEGLYLEAFKRFNGAESREKIVTRMADRLSKAFDQDRY